jgi:site-specific DNA recombinase
LLQGLIVCGHCRYAYYGKMVSRRAARGGQPYAYYRCVDTDAYRFGGEWIRENKEVRTSQLDDLIWQQVVALLPLLHYPERLR